jgi:two-component system response regulator RegA
MQDKPGNRMLLVDDDATFRGRLVKALSARGYEVYDAGDAASAIRVASDRRPTRAVVDLKMPGKSGLDLIGDLHALDPAMQIVVLTGYGSIATAVEAVRRGAMDYLQKPVDAEQILGAFERDADETPALPDKPTTPSLARVEWEHMQRILADCGGNISQAARKLGIHRRSLQRKLQKLPPLE